MILLSRNDQLHRVCIGRLSPCTPFFPSGRRRACEGIRKTASIFPGDAAILIEEGEHSQRNI